MDASIIAYSAQKSLFDRLEMVSNDVANSNTSGFKRELAVYLQPAGKINGAPNPLPTLKSATDLSQAGLRSTERQLDVAIQGNGFFQVDTPLGTRFTRAGSFFTNAEGALVTAEGYAVIGNGGPINLQAEDYEVKIGEDGTIVALTPNGQEPRGAIGVFKFSDNSALEKVGNTFFKTDATPDTAEVGVDYKMAQGMVEDSNVNGVASMTEIIDISRSVQNLAKIIQDQHSLIRSAVQRITAKA